MKKLNEGDKILLLAHAASYMGIKIKKGMAMRPCKPLHVCRSFESCGNIWEHCYEHKEKLHCPCCCNGKKWIPVIQGFKSSNVHK